MRLSFIAMGIALALAGCSRPAVVYQQQPAMAQPIVYQQPGLVDPNASYSDPNQCAAMGNDPNLCQQRYQMALAGIPHYGSLYACQSSFNGSCYDHGGWFGPMMMGFALSNMFNGGYGYYSGGHGYSHPWNYYNDRTTHYIVMHHYNVPRYTGHVVTNPAYARPAPAVNQAAVVRAQTQVQAANQNTPRANDGWKPATPNKPDSLPMASRVAANDNTPQAKPFQVATPNKPSSMPMASRASYSPPAASSWKPASANSSGGSSWKPASASSYSSRSSSSSSSMRFSKH